MKYLHVCYMMLTAMINTCFHSLKDHPDLDTKNLTLDDIILRTHPGKKSLKATGWSHDTVT